MPHEDETIRHHYMYVCTIVQTSEIPTYLEHGNSATSRCPRGSDAVATLTDTQHIATVGPLY